MPQISRGHYVHSSAYRYAVESKLGAQSIGAGISAKPARVPIHDRPITARQDALCTINHRTTGVDDRRLLSQQE